MMLKWDGKICGLCTREQRLAWFVSDELWEKAVIPYYQKSTLCLECFLRMADDRGVKVDTYDILLTGVIHDNRTYSTHY